MFDISRELSKEDPFLRVDFLVFNSQYYFGELTKFPASGIVKWKPNKWDEILGHHLVI